MFDLIAGKVQRPFHDRNVVPTFLSIAAHLFVVIPAVVVPALYITDQLPKAPVAMAFAAAPPPAPLPPPPPPRTATPAAARLEPKEVPATNALAAPTEAPAAITAEREVTTDLAGVEGGVPGGVVGGIVGGLVASLPPPPPPPPPPPRPTAPVRIGGQVKAPALTRRVQPVYPNIAVAAHVAGDVVLEATVGADGQVESVRVLQSRSHLLDKAAIDAVKQWQYLPLVLNDTAWPFVLTVTLTFSIQS